MLSMITAFLISTAPVPAQCRAVDGADQLWSFGRVRLVLVGEVHGTAEQPLMFSDLACLAAQSGRRVTVALEWSDDEQKFVDAFIASDGGARARTRFLQAPSWRTPGPDGRSSAAMLRLFDDLRQLRAARLLRRVVAISPARYNGPTQRNAGMAHRLLSVSRTSNDLVISLTGNVHASRAPIAVGGQLIPSMAALMPRATTMSLAIFSNGGTAWNCQDNCGVHSTGPGRSEKRRVILTNFPGQPFDGIIELGTPVSASPPAVPPLNK